MIEKTLSEAHQEVLRAAEMYEDTKRAEQLARSRATDALNALNEAQKALDEAIQRTRKTAPRDSHWGSGASGRGYQPMREEAR